MNGFHIYCINIAGSVAARQKNTCINFMYFIYNGVYCISNSIIMGKICYIAIGFFMRFISVTNKSEM